MNSHRDADLSEFQIQMIQGELRKLLDLTNEIYDLVSEMCPQSEPEERSRLGYVVARILVEVVSSQRANENAQSAFRRPHLHFQKIHALSALSAARDNFSGLRADLAVLAEILPEDSPEVRDLLRRCYLEPATWALDSGRWPESRDQAASWLQSDPGDLDAQALLRKSYLQPAAQAATRHEWQEARDQLSAWLRDHPKDTEALTHLRSSYILAARLALSDGQPEEAARHLQIWLISHPQDNEARELLQGSYLDPGSWTPVDIESHDAPREQYIGGAQRALESNRWDVAQNYLTDWLESHPGDSDAKALLGESFLRSTEEALQLNRWDQATEQLDDWLKIQPEDLAPKKLIEEIEVSLSMAAQNALEAHQFDEAESLLRSLLRAQPQSIEARSLLDGLATGRESFTAEPAESKGVQTAFAVARLKGCRQGLPLITGKEYQLVAGILDSVPEGFTGRTVELPDNGLVEIDVVVRAPGMAISPHWTQPVKFYRSRNSRLAEFQITPQRQGPQRVDVEFYYERHWLTQITFQVEVTGQRQPVTDQQPWR